MSAPPPSPRETLAHRLRVLLAECHTVREVRMFGGLSFMVDERIAVSAGRDGDLLVRVHPAEYDNLLQRGGVPAHMGADRPMGRGWITVPHQLIQDEAQLAYWVNIGIDSEAALGYRDTP